MINNKINILFLGGAKRVSLAERLILAGKSLKKEVNIFSYELDKFVPIASLAEIIIGKKWNDTDIYKHLNATIEKHKISIVIPFLDPATLIASNLKSINPDVFVPVSNIETCEIFFDKAMANHWFLENQFPVPHQNLNIFPLIAKPKHGSASQGILRLENQEQFNAFFNNNDIEKYLVQQFVIGDEYTVDCYVDINGAIISVVPRKRLETIAGEVSKSITNKDKTMIEISEQILIKANFRGPITIQFLKENNNLYIMEINPRLGGGVIASIEAGANIPLMILNDYLKIKNEKNTHWRDNLLMMRSNREFFIQT